MREIEEAEGSLVVTGSSYENKDNLTEEYLRELEANWGGTSLYRQEVLGEYLEQVEGALWLEEWINHGEAPGIDYDKIVIGVDPAVSVSRTSDETGIVIVAKLVDEYFVLEDLSGKHTPEKWSALCIDRAAKYGCEIIVEKNQGGQLLEKIIKDRNPYARVKLIHAMTSKEDRLGSAAIYYERGQVTHLEEFKVLETQMVSWTPESKKESPDRADALSHAIRYLSGKKSGVNFVAMPTKKIINIINRNQRGAIYDSFTSPSNPN